MPPRLLAISAGALDSTAGAHRAGALLAWLRELSQVPGVAVLLREKQLDDRVLFSLACSARDTFPGLLLVSGRPDMAIAARADGVHLPAAGLPVVGVRRRFPSLLVGVSTHATSEVVEAADQGAHYVTFGPVFATPSKETFGPAQGLEKLASACRCGLPVLAIGGIDEASASLALGSGAYGLAGIRCFASGASAERLATTSSAASIAKPAC